MNNILNNKYVALTWIASVLTAILFVLATFLYTNSDKQGPQILYESENVRYDGINSQLLLSDVTAYDQEDGDVSDTLRVKSVLETDEEIIVTYLAKDHNNNITESSRYIVK